MTDTMAPTAAPLTASARQTLCCLAGHMIPASRRHGVPGADDPAIFSDIVGSIDRDAPAIEEALALIDDLAGGSLAKTGPVQQAQAIARFRAAHAAMAAIIESLVACCYYRDARVLAALGVEPRPPFPQGYDVEQGDWSLLDPVRARGPIYRDAG